MTARPRLKSARLAGLSTVVGASIAIVGGVFVVRAIVDQWGSVRASLGHASPVWLAAGVVCAGAAMVAIALPWRRALELFGVHTSRAVTVAWYFMGEIGKYVPGGIWPIVGRGELARRGGLPRSAAYASVALSLTVLYLAAMSVTAILVPVRFLDGGGAQWLWVLTLLPLGLALLHHRPLGWMIGMAERLMKRELPVVVPPWRSTMGLLLRYVPSWLLVGTATWIVARAFDGSAGWMTIAPAAILSWVVGFVLVPVPGGLGVREAAFVALAGGSIPSGTRAAIALAARLCFMLVDAAGAAICVAYWRRRPDPRPGVLPAPGSDQLDSNTP